MRTLRSNSRSWIRFDSSHQRERHVVVFIILVFYIALYGACIILQQWFIVPTLHTHEYSELEDAHGEKVFESYAQNRTPGHIAFFDIMAQKRDR